MGRIKIGQVLLAAMLSPLASTTMAGSFKGTYFCDECLIVPGPQPQTSGDVYAFIRSQVNNGHLIWNMGDRILVCNDNLCALVERAMTSFIQIATPPRMDSGAPDGGSFGAHPSGGGAYQGWHLPGYLYCYDPCGTVTLHPTVIIGPA